MNKLATLSVYVLLYPAVAIAAPVYHEWSPSDSDPDNVLTNVSHFSTPLEDIPAKDYLLVKNSSGVPMKITLPQGTDFASTLAPYFQVDTGNEMTLDFAGAKWKQIDIVAENPYTQDARFGLLFRGSGYFTYAWLNHAQNGAFALENALVKLTDRTDGKTIDFLRGKFDFLSPNGIENKGGYLYVGAGGGSKFTMNFYEGSKFISPIFYIYGNASANEINFLGGEHYLDKLTFRKKNSGPSDDYARTSVNVTGSGTKLTVRDITPENTAGQLHGYQVYVSDGATLELTESVTQVAGAKYPIIIDGAKLSTGTSAQLTLSTAYLLATNSVLECNKIRFIEGHMGLHNGNSSVDALVLGYGYGKNESVCKLQMTGAAAVGTRTLSVGYSDKAFAELEMLGGAFTNAAGTTIAEGFGSSGRIRISDGEFVEKSNLIIGSQGPGEVVVEGGRLITPKINFVYNKASVNTSNKLHQTGGEIDVAGNICMVAERNSQNARADVVLEAGILSALSIYGGAGCSANNPEATGTATLSGNGGTIRAKGASADFISKLNAAKCGEKGLTIESNFDVTISQSFTNLDSGDGELILTGNGVKTLTGSETDVSRIVVAGGVLVLAEGARAKSELVVTNGARVVFAEDPSTHGITGFVCGDADTYGVLTVHSGRTLQFGTAELVFNNMKIRFEGEFPSSGSVEAIASAAELSDATLAAWKDAFAATGFSDDYAYGFSVSSNAGTSVLGIDQTSGRLITAAQNTVVTETISEGRMGVVVADVSADATLRLTGEVGKGGLVKKGEGALYLENAGNEFLRFLSLECGILGVSSYAAAGLGAATLGGLKLAGGVFAYQDGEEKVLPCALSVCSGKADAPVGIKVDSPLVVKSLQASGGALIKFGTAPLVFEPPSGSVVNLTPSGGTSDGDPKAPYSIGSVDLDKWTTPASGYKGFNIAEGEVVLRGDKDTTFELVKGLMIGVSATDGAVQPALTIDGAKVKLASSHHMFLGGFVQSDSFVTSPKLSILNGAEVSTYLFNCGRNCGRAQYPTVTVDRASWTVTDFRCGYNWNCYPRYFLSNGSRLNVTGVTNYGPSYFQVSNSVFAVQKNLELHAAGGEWFFGVGSTFEASVLKTTSGTPCTGFTLAFDGCTWKTQGSDKLFRLYLAEKFAFRTSGVAGLVLPLAEGENLPVERAISGSGGLVKTGAGALTFETQGTYDEKLTEKTPLEDPVTLAFEGLLDVREGTVNVAKGACRESGAYRVAKDALIDFGGNELNAAVFSGGGKVENAVLSGVAVGCADGEGRLEFSGSSFNGRVWVDFGRASDDNSLASGIVVAKVAGNCQIDLSKWRARNVGGDCSVRFSFADGVVKADIVRKFGMKIILR